MPVITEKPQCKPITNGLRIHAPAKLNLSLLIAGKRPDGFHNLESIMAKITWYDQIDVEQIDTEGIELICTGPCWAPEGPENLVLRAAQMVCEKAGITPTLKITLTKNIPAGSGLGSASSDAAATLIGLDRLFNTKLDYPILAQMAETLGSDVPFFLAGPIAMCTGKGEITENLTPFEFLGLVTVPDINVSTRAVYENYVHDETLYQKLHRHIRDHLKKNAIDPVTKMCANMLSDSAFRLHNELSQLKYDIESAGLGPMCLSGSGSSLFYMFDQRQKEEAMHWQQKLTERIGCKTVLVTNNRW